MRVSTISFYRIREQSIVENQGKLLEVQSALASGKRIDSPSDDPFGAADAIAIRAGLSQFEQFGKNQGYARNLLSLGESALGNVIDAVQDAQERLVQAGNGTLSDAQRGILATAIEATLQQLIALANSGDGAGGYLFTGSRETTLPFTQSGTAVSYNGDDIVQKMEVASGRFQQVRFAGDALFMKIPAGNGSFTTSAASANTGSGWINAGKVLDPAALTGRPYRVDFAVAGGVTTYTVQRDDGGGVLTAVATGTYSPPQAIAFEGIEVNVVGVPANGDRFDIAPAGYQSIFRTLADAVTALRTPIQGKEAAAAQFSTAMDGVRASMRQALDHVLTRRSEMGTSQLELDSYGELNDDRSIEYQKRLSAVEDLDYAAGVSELAKRQQSLEAALASYTKVARMSLFDYM